jgi:glycosyltransferase involved in cell wall biosynthesis
MLVSIVMTVRNEEAYLDECLRSINEQRLKEWELLVIDDHSLDRTTDILSDWSRRDARIKWQKNTGHGIIDALSQAEYHSKGVLITRMDGDDLMPREKLLILKKTLLEKGKGTMVSGRVQYFSEKEVSAGYISYQEWLNNRTLQQDHASWIYRECVIASPNWMCFRKDLESIGGFKALKYPEDYDLVLRWNAAGYSFFGIPELTHFWREHPERTSRNSSVYDQTSFYRLKIPYLINAFPDRTIIVFGKGQKSRLACRILSKQNVNYSVIDRSEDQYLSQKLTVSNPLKSILLLAVFPSEEERIKLESLLQEFGYHLGKNCFYI